MVASDFTHEEEQLIESEFQALLADYARTNHRQKVEIITRAYQLAKQAHNRQVCKNENDGICKITEKSHQKIMYGKTQPTKHLISCT